MESLAVELAAAIKLHQAGQLRAAEGIYRRMIEQAPGHADAWHLLGVLASQEGRLQAAIEHIGRALELAGEQPVPLYNLANVLRDQGDLAGAVARYRQAIDLKPDWLLPRLRLADALDVQGDLAGEIDCLQAALALAPDCLEAHLSLASAHHRRRNYDLAQHHYEEALRLQPDAPLVRNALGDACLMQGHLAQATEHYRLAIRSRPDRLLWRLRLDVLGPMVFQSNEEIDAYRAMVVERLSSYRDNALALETDELATSGCKPPVGLAYQGRDDLEIKRLFANIFTDRLPAQRLPTRSGVPRLGFVVAQGSEGVFLRGMAGVLNHLTPKRFQVLVIGAPSARDKVRRALVNPDVEFLTLPSQFSAAIDALRDAACDLLYFWEIGIDCLSYYLPFFRLAPVQCTSWGWPVTSGIDAVDYFLSSQLLEGPNAEAHYSERLVRLEHLPNYYSTPRIDVAPFDRSRLGLSAADHVFFCGQNPRKIHPDFDCLAAQILRRDRRGVLVLVEAPQPHVTEALRRRFQTTMPDCAGQIRFAPRMRSGDYLALMAAADAVLDTVHYGGGANSTYDAFSVGSPVVTLPSEFHRSRYAAASYRAMGLAQCVAATPDHYVDIALQLAGDPDRRREVSRAIVKTRGRLFDNLVAVRELEDFFETAVRNHGC